MFIGPLLKKKKNQALWYELTTAYFAAQGYELLQL